MNQWNGVGRLTRDPEQVTGGCRFTVACDAYDSRTKQKTADFIPCVAFGKLSDIIQQYARKGREVRITGKLRYRDYTDSSGNKRRDSSILVDDFELLAGGGQQAPTQTQAPSDPSDPSPLW